MDGLGSQFGFSPSCRRQRQWFALVAYASAFLHHELLARVLLTIEAVCLVLGVGSFWSIRKDKWVLKSALLAETTIAKEFQSAVEILGRRPSQLFPSMALWRAAQDEQKNDLNLSSSPLSNLKDQVGKTYERLQKEIEGHHATEAIATTLSWSSAVAILLCIGDAIYAHAFASELVSIWLSMEQSGGGNWFKESARARSSCQSCPRYKNR